MIHLNKSDPPYAGNLKWSVVAGGNVLDRETYTYLFEMPSSMCLPLCLSFYDLSQIDRSNVSV